MNEANRDFWENGSFYNAYVNNEFGDFRKDAWKDQILSHFCYPTRLNVLDTGCGPGFFCCILSEMGHSVTGIDRSSDMLKFAQENAQKLGVHPKFLNMDISSMTFSENSLDLIISRNVTWTLEEPERVYDRFFHLLKCGGRLLIYDANWHLPYYKPDLLKRVRENERWYYETYHKEFKVCDESATFFYELPLSNLERPRWDIEALNLIGFKNVIADMTVGEKLYTDWEKHLYSATPLFEISAQKMV